MNRVFLSGTTGSTPDFRYTPKGEKIARFFLNVDEGAFSIEVLYRIPREFGDVSGRLKGKMIVAGTLMKAGERSAGLLRLKAHRIFSMEE